MTRLWAGCAALLALGFTAACEDSASRELVAPDASADVAASASGSDDDSDGFSGKRHIAMRDDCNPRDRTYDMVGGCTLRRGDVTFAEFLGENDSPLALAVIGHQAWRNDPSYLKIRAGKTVRVRNEGGRPHTFTKVANFGGGKIGPPGVGLNEGLMTAQECPGSTDIPAGGSIEVSGLAVGNHRFQCCIHPWMRALIKVRPRGDHGEH